MGIEFDTYQRLAAETAIYPESSKVIYTALGLTNEAGEVAGKIKKIIRDSDGDFYSQEAINIIASEIGDVLWYLSQLCTDLGIPLNAVAALNLQKLADRQIRGVLGGSGDKR